MTRTGRRRRKLKTTSWSRTSGGDTGSRHTTCVHRAEDGDLGAGHEWPDGRVYVTVIKIDWVNRWTSPCNG